MPGTSLPASQNLARMPHATYSAMLSMVACSASLRSMRNSTNRRSHLVSSGAPAWCACMGSVTADAAAAGKGCSRQNTHPPAAPRPPQHWWGSLPGYPAAAPSPPACPGARLAPWHQVTRVWGGFREAIPATPAACNATMRMHHLPSAPRGAPPASRPAPRPAGPPRTGAAGRAAG